MKKYLLIGICMVLFPCAGFAEDIYISQAAQGIDSGINCSNAHSSSWFNTSGNWANPKQPGKIGPGDTAHLCGTILTELTTQANGNSGAVITILFESGAKFSTGTWTSNTGAITINNNYITLDGGSNGIIEATDNGTTSVFYNSTGHGTKTYNNDIYGVYINSGSNVVVRKLTVRNIYDRLASSNDCFKRGRSITIGGTSNYILVDHNTLSDGRALVFDSTSNTHDITISNNTIFNGGLGIGVAPGNTSSTGSNININGNNIQGGPKYDGTWGSECITNGCDVGCDTDDHFHQDGMHIYTQGTTGWLDGVNIYNNFLQDFGTHSTAHIYVESSYGIMQNVIIYNNVLVNTGSNFAANGMITIKQVDGVKIYNNTLYGPDTSKNIGIGLIAGIDALHNGDIKNNIISTIRYPVYWAVGTTFTADYNDIFNAPTFSGGGSQNNYAWWQGLGYDSHGTMTNPQLDSNYKLTSLSPLILINGGINLSNIGTTDKNGVTRPSVGGWSMGAYELKRPAPPTRLHMN